MTRPPPRTVTLGLVQHACPPAPGMDPQAAKAENLAVAEALIREAAGRGATLIATQELFTGPYFCQVEDESRFDLAEPIPGPTSDRLCALAAELGVHLTASLFERRTAGVYHNTSIMIDGTSGGASGGGGRKSSRRGRRACARRYRRRRFRG